MNNTHIIVTGGAGFIGGHLVERLIASGNSVVVIDDFSTGRLENLRALRRNPNLSIVRAKVSQCAELKQLVAQSTYIFHLAAVVGVELVMRAQIDTIHTNIRETEIILSAAAEHNVPLLFASTSEVYGKSQKPGFAENDDLIIGPPHLSRWSYACSKLMDEFLALAYAHEKKLPVTIARLFNTVGPRQTGSYGMVLPRFIEAAAKNESLKIFGDGKQSRCFCYVLDTVEALIRLQNSSGARGEIFNIGSNEEVSIRELAELVIRVTDSKSSLEFVPYQQAYGDGFEDMLRRKPVIEKLRAVTGFAPKTSLEEIVRLTAAAKS